MRRLLIAGVIAFLLLAVGAAAVAWVGFQYAYEPPLDNVISRIRTSPQVYDLWGHGFTQEEADRLLQTSSGRAQLSPHNGAVKIDDALLRLGRTTFYKQTFANEIFLTDIVGILDGPFRISNVTRAILALKGRGTTNLRVPVPETVTIGGRTFQKGSYFDTGLDVPRGALLPLGISLSVSRWRIRAGITCALCHARVDSGTGKIVEGAPNQDFNAGLLLALATNSAAYFMHTDVMPLRDAPLDATRTVISSTGQKRVYPISHRSNAPWTPHC